MEAGGDGEPQFPRALRNLAGLPVQESTQTPSQSNRQGLILFRPTFTGWWSRKSSPGLGPFVCKGVVDGSSLPGTGLAVTATHYKVPTGAGVMATTLS